MTPFPYQGNSILSTQGKSQPMINHNTLRMTLTPPWFNVGNKGSTRSLRTLTQTRRCLPHSLHSSVQRPAQVDGGVEGREGRPSDNGRTSLTSHYADQAVSSR